MEREERTNQSNAQTRNHTARHAETTILGLQGSSNREPEIRLEELEKWASVDIGNGYRTRFRLDGPDDVQTDDIRIGEETFPVFQERVAKTVVDLAMRGLSRSGEETEETTDSSEALVSQSINRSLGYMFRLLKEMKAKADQAKADLLVFLSEFTGRSKPSLSESLRLQLSPQERSQLMDVCKDDVALFERVLPFAGLLRKDASGNFLVIIPDSVSVSSDSNLHVTGNLGDEANQAG
jgi:hypothetical protein